MESTQEQLEAVIKESKLSTDGHQYSSRRERIAAHLMAAIIVSGGENGAATLTMPLVVENLVDTAIGLTDKLIARLAEESLDNQC